MNFRNFSKIICTVIRQNNLNIIITSQLFSHYFCDESNDGQLVFVDSVNGRGDRACSKKAEWNKLA